MKFRKILFGSIITLFALIMMSTMAFAADALPSDNVGSYMTWEFLGTISGATAAVLLIVQFIKAPLDKIWRIPTRFIVYIFSFIILISVEYFSVGNISYNRFGLILLNAIIVTIAAMGAYEATFHKLDIKKQT